jgi:small subunit ribosomal protein S4
MMDKCTKCRKFGTKLFLKGDRCSTPNCALTRRNYLPGAHGVKKSNSRKSEYGLQLVEKQKAKAEYGLRETQFANIFKRASKSRENTGEELFRLLETRLDNLVYRIGWAVSRAQARQIVLHRKIQLNGRINNIPSTTLKVGDIIDPVSKEVIKPAKITAPAWVALDEKALTCKIKNLPNRDEIDTDIDDQLIIEFYSR